MDYSIDPIALKDAMRHAGIGSIRRLALLSGVHRNTIGPLLRSGRSPFNDSYLALCATLGADPMALLRRQHEPARQVIEEACEAALQHYGGNNLCFFLFGSRAEGTARRFSDYDLGMTGGRQRIISELFLRMREDLLTAADDLPYRLDVVNFDAAPSAFLSDFSSPLVWIAGSRESLAYLEGRIHGHHQNAAA